jgi:hypothetical protein
MCALGLCAYRVLGRSRFEKSLQGAEATDTAPSTSMMCIPLFLNHDSEDTIHSNGVARLARYGQAKRAD